MSWDTTPVEPLRPEQELRSEFLRGQMRHWMEEIVAAGKTADLFELEMWLRSFERFFRIKNQALSDKETKQFGLRNWSEELRLVDSVLQRAMDLCRSILTEEQVNQTRFDKYLETYLKKDDAVDPFIERLLRRSTPEAGLTLLREAFEDIHILLSDLVQISRIPYATFAAVGEILHREVRRSDLIAFLIDKKFKPIHDRITNPAIAATIRKIARPQERKPAARVFLEFFRLLRYLDYADPDKLAEDHLKNTILIFALITSETRLLLSYLEGKVLKTGNAGENLHGLYDSFVYCLPLELKKVINTELMDISASRQADTIRARVENSHGILKDCYQQSVVQLSQVFDPKIQGQDIFPDFMAKRDQSVRLRDGLAVLIKALREFQAGANDAGAVRMKEEISRFYDNNMKYLMYRDWSGFEMFFIEILKCNSLPGLLKIGHRFDTFLMTLFREVQKRAILQNAPLSEDLRGIEASA